MLFFKTFCLPIFLRYVCEDSNELFQTDMMMLNCPDKKWVRESCPVSCRAQGEMCSLKNSQSTSVQEQTNFKPTGDMSENCKTVWQQLCDWPMVKKACPESC